MLKSRSLKNSGAGNLEGEFSGANTFQPNHPNNTKAAVKARSTNRSNDNGDGGDNLGQGNRVANDGARRRRNGANYNDRRGTGTRRPYSNAIYPPISEHLLRKLTEERDPDQLIIALEANPTWKRLLASNFTVGELSAILSACAKCAEAHGTGLLRAFVENVLTNKEGGGQHFVTRAANLLGNTRFLTNFTTDSSLPERTEGQGCSSQAHVSESLLIENALKLVEVKEELNATRYSTTDSEKNTRDRRPRILRGYRITGAAPNNFREMSILPTKADLDQETPFLRKNIIKGSYSDVEDYLDVQFRLLREDYVTPLRVGLQQFRGLELQNRRQKLNSIQDVRFYLDVRFSKEFSERTFGSAKRVVLQLSKHEFSQIDWERSKRLINGSLIGASHDNFETIVFLTVIGRDPDNLKKGVLQLELCQCEDAVYFKTGVDYSLIESSGAYFETYRHNLAVLQIIESENFPFAKNLVMVEKEIRPPQYMGSGKILDVSPILKSTTRSSPSSPMYRIEQDRNEDTKFHIRGSHGWPPVEDTCLNRAQMQALITAFDKEVCIVQGPPGTGKTFLGLKIVEMLLLNSITSKPLLIVCYSNHALDQFLEAILKITKNIVRIGGRCRNESVEIYNLWKLRCRHERSTEPPFSVNNVNEESIRQLIRSNHVCCDGLKERIQETQSLLDQLLGRKTFDVFYEKLRLPFHQFIKLDTVIEEFQDKQAQNEHAEEFDKEEDGYLSDEDRGTLEDNKQKEDANSAIFNTVHEQAVFARLGSWQQRFDNIHHLLLAELKVEQISKLSSKGEHVPEELKLNLDERWLIYRKYHWEYALIQVSEYLARCARAQTANYIYVSRETLAEFESAARKPMEEEDKIMLVIQCLKAGLSELRRELSQKIRELNELELALDLELTQYKAVIGITTTGAAKYNRLVQRLACEIIIIEEAAEILEAHLITALNPQTKQLILIGDHQQLQPSTTVFALAKDFGMQVSLFERLLTNGLPYVRLQEQHRMRDEFLQLLVPTIYEDYFSHISVYQYEHVRGVTQDLCFVTHTEAEDAEHDSRSKSNVFEARFAARLALHLRMHDYKPEDIVILTTYSRQVFTIRNEFRAINNEMNYTSMKNETVGPKKTTRRVAVDHQKPVSPFEGIRVTTVDNFQGEESEVIIASFVRSNEDAKIGFLSRENRVCVALSRAKKGLYCVGNLAMLAKASGTWHAISAKLLNRGCVKKGIELICERHSRKLLASTPEEFAAFSYGGCDQPCDARLKCGHVCTMSCHKHDANHVEYKCLKACRRPRSECNHPCVLQCFEECGDCTVKVVKRLPCDHEAVVPCFMPVYKVMCHLPCERSLGCEHPCKSQCYKSCPKCMEFVTEDSPCGHKVTIVCRDRKDPFSLERACTEKVSLKLRCGHNITVHCNDRNNVESLRAKCNQLKDVQCTFKHDLKVTCQVDGLDIDRQCTAISSVKLFCGHEMKTVCNKMQDAKADRINLTANCKELVPYPSSCGHIVRIACCKLRYMLSSTESSIRGICNFQIEETLDCGHTHKRKCNQPQVCTTMVKVDKTPCSHEVLIPCWAQKDQEALKRACQQRCQQTLLCGHKCKGDCESCLQGSFHKECPNKCGKVLFCGHQCPSICHDQCLPCQVVEPHRCHHTQRATPCMSNDNPFDSCDKKPFHPCDHIRPCAEDICLNCICRCNEPCKRFIKYGSKTRQRNHRKTRNCQHNCAGLCGESCFTLCRVCDKDKLHHIPVADGVQQGNARYIQLACNHIFEVQWLDKYMEEQMLAILHRQELKFPKCPKASCPAQIRYVRRYNFMLLPIRRNMATVMTRVFGDSAVARTSLQTLFKNTIESSNFEDYEKCRLLTRVNELLNLRLSQNTVDCFATLVKILEEQRANLPDIMVWRLTNTKYYQRQLFSDVVRFLRSQNMPPITLPPVPEQTEHWGACGQHAYFSRQEHKYCHQCPPRIEEKPEPNSEDSPN
ncbi:NFX1-type zinc finger-containing protein 1-like isoform X2 [Varroa jacobsoni]|uniref:NFX1-type zinc finger-containing protein 1-like isoform X2 n=1 Tax=Varroa jacobsoni TaxID=62625 RepID=UPI000BF703B8|nr:NFX1-type zinc finger-containing protein 1-like isoform X2 [Varroa jacobsoni]